MPNARFTPKPPKVDAPPEEPRPTVHTPSTGPRDGSSERGGVAHVNHGSAAQYAAESSRTTTAILSPLPPLIVLSPNELGSAEDCARQTRRPPRTRLTDWVRGPGAHAPGP